MKKNLFFTFCFSFIPGAGQMYQNYMKRGLSIMMVFMLFIGFSILFSNEIFALPLPIIFAYSFFDTYNIRNKKDEDDEPKDEYIWDVFNLKNTFTNIDEKKRNLILGVILICFGTYVIFNNVILNILGMLELYELRIYIYEITDYLPLIIISLLSLYAGVRILANKEK